MSGRRARRVPGGTPRFLLAAALFVGPFAVLFHDALAGRAFCAQDLTAYHRPYRTLLRPLVTSSLGLASWNPFTSNGQPFAASPAHELWHPLTALFLLLPFEVAFRLQVLLPIASAFAGMLFLLRALRLGLLASLLGAVSWAWGGYLLSVTRLLPTLVCLATLPFVLGCAARLARGAGFGAMAGLALSFGLMLLAPEPATLLALPLLLAAAVASAVGATEVAPAPAVRLRVRGWLGRLAGALLLGVLVGSAALLPGFAFAAKTVRSAIGVPEAHAFGWALRPERLWELLTPAAPAAASDPSSDLAGAYLASLYPGLLATLCALLAVRRRTWPWLAAALPPTLLALGGVTPIWGWLRESVGLLTGVRYPERFSMTLIFAVAVLGAHGFEELARGRDAARRAMRLAGVAAFLGVAGALLHRPFEALRLVAVASILGALLALAAGRRRRLALCALVCVTAAELALEGRRLVPTAPMADVETPPPALRPLVGLGPDRRLFHHAEYRVAPGDRTAVAAPPRPAQWGIATALQRDFDLTGLRWSAEASWAVSRLLEERSELAGALLSRRGIDWVLRTRPGAEPRPGTLELLRNEGSTGLAFPARRMELATGVEVWLRTVARLGSEHRTAVVLHENDAGRVPAEPSGGTVEARRPWANVLELSVLIGGPAPGLVAINETWDDGWSATVDGAWAAVLRADLSLMAVAVPPGPHTVRLRHADPLLAPGLALSGLGLAACAALAAAALRQRAPKDA